MTTTPLCADRVCVVTGAGNGLGRAYARMLAAHGASVVVNDVGSSPSGAGSDAGPAETVVAEINADGGTAVANTDDVSSWAGAQALIDTAISTYGRLDVLINNAGILRDRTILKMTEQEWDDVIRVHLKGTFGPSHFAIEHWRARYDAGEQPVGGRLINTTSVSGIFGNFGQANYAAAKAGIAGFTIVAALELAKLGVTANAISPGAFTRLTENLRERTEEEKAQGSPDWVAPLATWLASSESSGVTGRVILSSGTRLAVAEGWVAGPSTTAIADPIELGEVLTGLVAEARGNADMSGAVPES